MRTEDLVTSPADLSYDELMQRIANIREARGTTPAKTEDTKKGKRAVKKKAGLKELLEAMTPEERLQFMKENLGG